MKTEPKEFHYETKCRKCGRINKMYFGHSGHTTKEDFKTWVNEHSAFPIQRQCVCDNGMMMLHDIISFGNILNITIS